MTGPMARLVLGGWYCVLVDDDLKVVINYEENVGNAKQDFVTACEDALLSCVAIGVVLGWDIDSSLII